MKLRSALPTLIVLAMAASMAAQSGPVTNIKGGHPDLSGTWLFSIGLPPLAIKKQTNGATSIKGIDASANQGAAPANVPGARPSQPACPSWRSAAASRNSTSPWGVRSISASTSCRVG